MKNLRRVTLFGSFAAVGVGLAICVGVSDVPPTGQEQQPATTLGVRAVVEGTVPIFGQRREASARKWDCPPPLAPLAAEPPRSDLPAPRPRSVRSVAASISVPTEAEPYPPYAQEGISDAEKAKLQQAYDYLKQQIEAGALPTAGAAKPAAPAAAPAGPAAPPAAAGPLAQVKAGKTDRAGPKAVVDAEGDGKLSIHIQNADIREVLDLLSEQGNLNILAGKEVQGKVSATLTGVDIDSALDAILKSTGFVSRREGKFIFVGTPEEFTTLDRPNYVTAVELQKLIQPILTEKIGVVGVSTPAQVGIATDSNTAGGNSFSGGDVVVVRDYEAVLAQVDQMVREVDVRPLQVHIEAMILSVHLKDSDKFGVNWQLLRDKPNIKFSIGAPLQSLADFTFEKGTLKFGFLDSSLGAFLDALETIGDTNVIATPRLMVLNKQRAEIQIGEKKGYVSTTVTETSSTQAVEFLDIGALLRLRPFISTDGLIRMEVHPELSDGSVDVVNNFTLPNKSLTQVTTNIMVRDGCTVIIGGLMRENLATTTSQVPVIGNLPLLGPLFRSKQESVERHEVLVLITPHIVYEPGTCREGEKEAGEFHRRESLYADKMSPLGKRSIGRRYFRLAQSAYAAGDRDTALRFAEMSVHFDPLNRAAIDLRSDIWLGKPCGDHTLQGPPPNGPAVNPLEGQQMADWLLEDLERAPLVPAPPAHPLDPGQPGHHQDMLRPRRLQ